MTTDTFTGGSSSDPVNWSDDGAWTASAPPGTGDLVAINGYSVLDVTNTTSPTAEEQIAGLSLATGANLNLGANILDVTGTGLATFGGAGSTLVVAGGNLTVDSAVTSAAGIVNVTDGGYIYEGTHNAETVNVSGGLFDVDGTSNSATVNLSGSGKLFLDSSGNNLTVNMTGGQLEVESTGNAGKLNVLGNGQLIVNGPVAYNAMIGELGVGHTLEVENQGGETAHSYSTDAATNSITLNFTAGATTLSYTLKFDQTTDPVANLAVAISNGSFDITATAAVCFVSGSQILTVQGETPVETLQVGDSVITASGEARPIRWIGHRTLQSPSADQRPVRVRAGAFEDQRPCRDLWLSPGHAVCVDALGEVFVPIDHLINGVTILREEVSSEVTYWHVELDTHDVLLAEGLPCESYMDAGNRGFFGREYGRLAEVDPARVAQSLAAYARPFVDGGPILEAVRERLALRAEALGAEEILTQAA